MSPAHRPSLYTYYLDKDTLPTYARFSRRLDLDRHQENREALFRDKLHILPLAFDSARVIEFGPDSGENSLVFGRWNAQLTLVEPNPQAWPRITSYFRMFGLLSRLKSLEKRTLERFATPKRYQFVVAEGFIYTVRPESTWINLFHRLLEPNGLAIVSYYEASGTLFELLIKAIHSFARERSGLSPEDIAWKLYESKWNSIPHTRSFRSWVMDVLENPFVRLKYFFQADAFCRKMWASGFDLYSSWPTYRDPLIMRWHKSTIPGEEALEETVSFIQRSQLSFALAGKCYLGGESPSRIRSVTQALTDLLGSVDRLIDSPHGPGLGVAHRAVKALTRVVEGLGSEGRKGMKTLGVLDRVLQVLKQGDLARLLRFCNSDREFIQTWGLNTHYGIFRKRE